MTDHDDLPTWAVVDRGHVERVSISSKSEWARSSPLRRVLRGLYRFGVLALAVGVGFAAGRLIDGDLLARISDSFESADANIDASVEPDVADVEVAIPAASIPSGQDDQAATIRTTANVIQPTVNLALTDYQFILSAVVPGDAVAAAMEMAVADTYGAYGASEVMVDPATASEPWLDLMPMVIEVFSQILDGSITVSADQVLLTGRSPSQTSVDSLVELLSVDHGFPPLTNGVELVELKPLVVEAIAAGGVLTLGGVVPTVRVKDDLVAASVALYGEDNVVDNLQIDDATFARFDVLRLATDLAVFQAGGDFTVGLRHESFYATLEDGVSFEPAEAILTVGSRQLLADLARLINRTRADVSIVGHTDDVGSDDDNLALSKERAAAVADFLVSQQVDRARLLVSGQGESEPVASNDTGEGRDRNRRVVITIGDSSL